MESSLLLCPALLDHCLHQGAAPLSACRGRGQLYLHLPSSCLAHPVAFHMPPGQEDTDVLEVPFLETSPKNATNMEQPSVTMAAELMNQVGPPVQPQAQPPPPECPPVAGLAQGGQRWGHGLLLERGFSSFPCGELLCVWDYGWGPGLLGRGGLCSALFICNRFF
ncbi:unnamed protein product [Lepidochelys olivacea]